MAILEFGKKEQQHLYVTAVNIIVVFQGRHSSGYVWFERCKILLCLSVKGFKDDVEMRFFFRRVQLMTATGLFYHNASIL